MRLWSRSHGPSSGMYIGAYQSKSLREWPDEVVHGQVRESNCLMEKDVVEQGASLHDGLGLRLR